MWALRDSNPQPPRCKGGVGGKVHSLDEWWLNKEGYKAIQLSLLILLSKAGI